MMVGQFEINEKKFTAQEVIELLINKLNSKSSHVEKSYPPLKYIFLINNLYFILSKIKQQPLSTQVNSNLQDVILEKIKDSTTAYLEVTWKKVMFETFNDSSDKITFEKDGKTLTSYSREHIKKKFAVYCHLRRISMNR